MRSEIAIKDPPTVYTINQELVIDNKKNMDNYANDKDMVYWDAYGAYSGSRSTNIQVYRDEKRTHKLVLLEDHHFNTATKTFDYWKAGLGNFYILFPLEL